MTFKKKSDPSGEDDLRGFEDFIKEMNVSRGGGVLKSSSTSTKKNESNFENFTFLINDTERMHRINTLIGEKMNLALSFDQSRAINSLQKDDIAELREKIFLLSDKPNSNYRKNLAEIFNTFYISNS